MSSATQSLETQIEKLKAEGCSKIYQEKESGSIYHRPQLKVCLDYVREGDILIVTKLDRLARSTFDLCRIAKELESKDVALKVIDQNIDTSDATGRLLFNMLGAIAQFENEMRAERQREGIIKAQNRGVVFGRARTVTESQVQEMVEKRKEGALIKDLMKAYNLSKPSIYRYLSQYNEKGT